MIPEEGMLAPYVDGHLSLLRLPSVEGARCVVMGGIADFHAQFLRTAGANTVTALSPDAPLPTGLDLILAYGVLDRVGDPVPAILRMMDGLGMSGTLVVDLELRPGENLPGQHPHLPWLGDLRRGLAGYVLRLWPCGTPDEPGRFILHVCVRRPTILFIDARPNSGKSSLVALMDTPNTGVRVFSLDMFLHRLRLGEIPDAGVVGELLRATHPRLNGLNLGKVAALGRQG